ncbi:MAG: DUF2064 domain-containing protein [Pseudomonadota bacterium]
MSLRVGLAIFVKTPGHSPLKTRLARAIGIEAAQHFHLLAAAAVAAVATSARRDRLALVPHWAVAEAGALGHPSWRALPTIAQGEGDLGERMGRVTDSLLARFDAALLLGADAPQIEPGDLGAAVDALATHRYVIGPSADGGFWLFATRGEVPSAAWSATPWSQPDTAARFCQALGDDPIDPPTARLRSLRDADTAEDLPPLLSALDALRDPLPEQQRLADWLRAQSL